MPGARLFTPAALAAEEAEAEGAPWWLALPRVFSVLLSEAGSPEPGLFCVDLSPSEAPCPHVLAFQKVEDGVVFVRQLQAAQAGETHPLRLPPGCELGMMAVLPSTLLPFRDDAHAVAVLRPGELLGSGAEAEAPRTADELLDRLFQTAGRAAMLRHFRERVRSGELGGELEELRKAMAPRSAE